MPMYDAAGTIVKALDSLSAQTIDDWEAIVVDDGSHDEGPELVARAALQDPRIILVRQPNGGLAAARNAGLERARGRYLHFLDSDDWMLPDAFERLTRAAIATGAAYSGAAFADAQGHTLRWSLDASCPLVGFNELLEGARWVPAAQLVAADAFKPLRFDPAYPGLEDYDVWLRLAARGMRWTALDGDVCAYRMRPRSMSRGYESMAEQHARLILRGFDAPMPEADQDPARRTRLLAQTALNYATALVSEKGSAGHDAGIDIMRRHAPGSRVTGEQAAHAAWWMFPYARCRPPVAWRDAADDELAAWCAVLAKWWERLESSGVAGSGMTESGRRALAACMTLQTSVAASLAEQAPTDRPTVIMGLGRQAVPLIRALARLRRPFVGFDDASPRMASIKVGGVDTTLLCDPSQFDAGALYIVTPRSADRLLARVPRDAACIVWSDEAARLASAALERLEAGWRGEPGPTIVATGPRLGAAA